jgi:hypothetical protein
MALRVLELLALPSSSRVQSHILVLDYNATTVSSVLDERCHYWLGMCHTGNCYIYQPFLLLFATLTHICVVHVDISTKRASNIQVW